jgi:hypothetical protein
METSQRRLTRLRRATEAICWSLDQARALQRDTERVGRGLRAGVRAGRDADRRAARR